jgi:aryl-alcohol dehydrogenase-like predicted oxidoreductase
MNLSPRASDRIYRRLGKSDIFVSPVALGCWPISGMTSLEVNDADSLQTIAACFDVGINFLDTAYCYGPHGESERLIAKALGNRRDEMVIATKGGAHWDANGQRVLDGRPDTLQRECEESLRRLNTDRVELLYLHAPDPMTPIAESAAGLRKLLDAGKTRAIGVSNCTISQIEEFQAVCPISAVQPPYNMLQREIEKDCIPWCQAHDVSVNVYWPLMKGLLTGKFRRDHVFDPRDGRKKYPMFQGDEWQKNFQFVEALGGIAKESGITTAQLVIHWTIHQPGITAALCGAKRRSQILETAQAMRLQLTEDQQQRIEAAIKLRGTPITKSAI